MNSHDKAIADELQINSFVKKSISANVPNPKSLVINLSSYFSNEKIKSKNELSLFDELDYGNYE